MKIIPKDTLQTNKEPVQPITDWEGRENKAGQSTDSFKMFVLNSPIAIYIAQNGEIRFSNYRFQKLSDYSQDELRGMNALNLVFPEDRNLVKENHMKLLEKGHSSAYEYRFLPKSGNITWILETSASISYEARPAVLAYLVDITQHKQTKESVRESEGFFQTLTETTIDIIWEMDCDFKLTYANPTFKDLLGYEPQEVIGKWAFWFNPPEEAEAAQKMFRATFQSRRPFVGLETTNVHKDGRLVVLESSGVPFFDASGRLLGYRGIDRDITKRKRVEQALRESEEFSSNLLRNSPNPILVVNPDTSVRYINRAFERLTGFPSSEIIGKKIPYPWWKTKSLYKAKRGFRKDIVKGVKRREEVFVKESGERFWVEITCLAVESGGRLNHYLESWVDVTEQKKLSENIGFYITEITRAQEEERKRIARELHDETIQQMFGVITDIDNTIKHKRSLPIEQMDQLVRVKKRIGDIMDEIRRFSHELRPGILDEFGLIPSLEMLVEEFERVSKIDCQLKVIGFSRRLLSETELVLFRIAQEALHNVGKHSKATRALVRIRFTSQKVKLQIIDNGTGFELPKEMSIFARRGKLGLVGISERARLINGNLSVKSGAGKGSTIAVEVAV